MIKRGQAVAIVSLLVFGRCLAQSSDEAIALADHILAESQSTNLLQAAEASAAPAPAAEPALETKAQADATNARKAATQAKEAARVATNVAHHSIKITEHAKSALKNANDALHNARVDTEGLSADQKTSLKEAEKKLREATKAAEYGQVKEAKYVKAKAENKKLDKLEKKMEEQKGQSSSELEAMRKEIEELRRKIKEKDEKSDDEALKELEQQIRDMEAAEKKEDKVDAKSHDEMKAEIERLRELINSQKNDTPKPTPKATPPAPANQEDAVKVEEKGLDIDTAMPYGDLEPFGREDTAQELTENSIKESDEMVDQLERAEVAEEKRAVFRALTRLRGAAITSFDGVARSQTGNIDEYNKIHQWRETHPLHHLADEESDVSKWAFPDNAD